MTPIRGRLVVEAGLTSVQTRRGNPEIPSAGDALPGPFPVFRPIPALRRARAMHSGKLAVPLAQVVGPFARDYRAFSSLPPNCAPEQEASRLGVST